MYKQSLTFHLSWLAAICSAARNCCNSSRVIHLAALLCPAAPSPALYCTALPRPALHCL